MHINKSIIDEIRSIIAESRQSAIKAVDHQRVIMYWKIGKRIFEEEQEGKDRAEYGKYLIKYLSKQLQPQFGSGYSSRNLNLFRQFYRAFPIVQTVSAQLGWSQYVLLIRIDTQDKHLINVSATCLMLLGFVLFAKVCRSSLCYLYLVALEHPDNYREGWMDAERLSPKTLQLD